MELCSCDDGALTSFLRMCDSLSHIGPYAVRGERFAVFMGVKCSNGLLMLDYLFAFDGEESVKAWRN